MLSSRVMTRICGSEQPLPRARLNTRLRFPHEAVIDLQAQTDNASHRVSTSHALALVLAVLGALLTSKEDHLPKLLSVSPALLGRSATSDLEADYRSLHIIIRLRGIAVTARGKMS